MVALSRGLRARVSGIELPHGNGPPLLRNERCVSGELRVAGLTSFTVITVPEKFSCGTGTAKAFLSPWKGCDN